MTGNKGWTLSHLNKAFNQCIRISTENDNIGLISTTFYAER